MGNFKKLDTKIKTETTKVIFRKFKDGDIIALFPEIPATLNMNKCLSYQHIGQHGAASCNLYFDTKPIAIDDCPCQVQINQLHRELRAMGYTLKVVSRFSYQMDQKRIAAIRAYNTVPSDNVDEYLPEVHHNAHCA